MSRQETRRVSRRVVLGGWIALPVVVPWLSGCGSETVEVKGGTTSSVDPAKVSARAKEAAKAEAEIFKKTRKLR